MLIRDEAITASQEGLNDAIWHFNMLGFDVEFNKNEIDLLREDCENIIACLKQSRKDVAKLKAALHE